jgi:hypothetical protein
LNYLSQASRIIASLDAYAYLDIIYHTNPSNHRFIINEKGHFLIPPPQKTKVAKMI